MKWSEKLTDLLYATRIPQDFGGKCCCEGFIESSEIMTEGTKLSVHYSSLGFLLETHILSQSKEFQSRVFQNDAINILDRLSDRTNLTL